MKTNLVLAFLCSISLTTFADDYVVGQLAPKKTVIVKSEVSGVVDQFNVDNGDTVTLASPLLSISKIDYSLNLELAKFDIDVKYAELETQEKQLLRYQSLLKSNGISKGNFEEQLRITNISRAQYSISKTQYKIAERALNKASLKAPFGGFVTQRSVEVGQFISVGDPLYTIADLTKLIVQFYLLETDFDQFQKGDNVNVYIPSTEQTLSGIVSTFSPVKQDNTPGFLVEVTLDNTHNQLYPGMEVYIHFNEVVK